MGKHDKKKELQKKKDKKHSHSKSKSSISSASKRSSSSSSSSSDSDKKHKHKPVVIKRPVPTQRKAPSREPTPVQSEYKEKRSYGTVQVTRPTAPPTTNVSIAEILNESTEEHSYMELPQTRMLNRIPKVNKPSRPTTASVAVIKQKKPSLPNSRPVRIQSATVRK